MPTDAVPAPEPSAAEFREAMGRTLRAIRGHGAFVVNVLAAPQQHLSRNFARRGLAAAWDGIQHRRGPTGSPRLEDVLAVPECPARECATGAGIRAG